MCLFEKCVIACQGLWSTCMGKRYMSSILEKKATGNKIEMDMGRARWMCNLCEFLQVTSHGFMYTLYEY